MKTITVEKDGLTVVARERSARDNVDEAYIHGAIATTLAKRQGITDIAKLSNRAWAGITAVTPIIQQIVSLDGDWPFTLPVSDTDEALTAFHDAVLDAPEQYLELLTDAVKAAKKSPVPNESEPQHEPRESGGSDTASTAES